MAPGLRFSGLGPLSFCMLIAATILAPALALSPEQVNQATLADHQRQERRTRRADLIRSSSRHRFS